MTLSENTHHLVEAAGKLLESDGWVLKPGVWGRWVVVPDCQKATLGWSAFLLPA